MEKSLFEKITSKYIRRAIFSFIKIPTLLKLLIPYKNLRKLLDITPFHYHYYSMIILFKNIDIKEKSSKDIISKFNSYLGIFPEETRYKALAKLIITKKYFPIIELNIDI